MSTPRRNPYRRTFNENVVDAIHLSGWNVIFLSSIYASPFKVRMYRDDERRDLNIYGWGITHGGGSRSRGEYRIQVQVTEFLVESGVETVILGWWHDVGVFAAFDVYKHLGILGDNDSIQISRTSLQSAAVNGLSLHRRNNGELAVAFRPEVFAEYSMSLRSLHEFGMSERDTNTLEDLLNETDVEVDPTVNDEDVANLAHKRQKFSQTVVKKVRDSSFKRRVLNAYNSCCAFCGVQLRLIDAAHILPVEIDGSTDLTANGIALCALHHRAYDASLITFDNKYNTYISNNRLQKLTTLTEDAGLPTFRANLRPMIIVPPGISDRPNVAYINEANSIRGWDDVKKNRIV